jgi:CHAD domain-containing protein
VRRAIAVSVRRLILHDPGVRLGGDPEAVHQARVAVRRLRSDLRTFSSLLVEPWSQALREELRWLGGELGGVRDAEVLAGEIAHAVERLPEADRSAGGRLVADFEADIAAQRERLLGAMRTERYLALVERLVDAARAPMLTEAAEERARDILPGLLRRPWRKLRRDARHLGDGASDEELHALRIRAKRARYAVEAGVPVLGGRARRFARAVAILQDVLGAHHDAVVAGERLRARGASRPLAFVAGQAWGIERDAGAESRAAWPRAWRRARRRRLRSWT